MAINGIGERAGNCALEEVVMALRTRADHYGVTTGVDTTKLVGASRLLSKVTDSPVPRNKAIVGINAFAHEAGIHQHGMTGRRPHLRDHAPAGRRASTAASSCSASTRAATPWPSAPRCWVIALAGNALSARLRRLQAPRR